MCLNSYHRPVPPSTAYWRDRPPCCRGDAVVILTDNDMLRTLVASDGNKAVLAGAIRAVTGRKYRVGIRKPEEPKAAAPSGDDPLTGFLRSSRALGVEIQIKDEI